MRTYEIHKCLYLCFCFVFVDVLESVLLFLDAISQTINFKPLFFLPLKHLPADKHGDQSNCKFRYEFVEETGSILKNVCYSNGMIPNIGLGKTQKLSYHTADKKQWLIQVYRAPDTFPDAQCRNAFMLMDSFHVSLELSTQIRIETG